MLLRTKVTRWRGKAAAVEGGEQAEECQLDSGEETGRKEDLDDDLSLMI